MADGYSLKSIETRLCQNLPWYVTPEDMGRLTDRQLQRLLSHLHIRSASNRWFSVIKVTHLGLESLKEEQNLLEGEDLYRPDRDWKFVSDQRADTSSTLSTIAAHRAWTISSIAAATLRMKGRCTEILHSTADALIRGGHTVIPQEIHKMVALTHRGVSTGMSTEGFRTFFFYVDNHGNLKVGSVGQILGPRQCFWSSVPQKTYDLDYSLHDQRERFLIRNLHTLKF